MSSCSAGVGRGDALWQTAESSAMWVIQSAAVWPRWPVRCTPLCRATESGARVHRHGKSSRSLRLADLSHGEHRVEVLGGERGDHQTMQRTRARPLQLNEATGLLSHFLSLSRTLVRARKRTHTHTVWGKATEDAVVVVVELRHTWDLPLSFSVFFIHRAIIAIAFSFHVRSSHALYAQFTEAGITAKVLMKVGEQKKKVCMF